MSIVRCLAKLPANHAARFSRLHCNAVCSLADLARGTIGIALLLVRGFVTPAASGLKQNSHQKDRRDCCAPHKNSTPRFHPAIQFKCYGQPLTCN